MDDEISLLHALDTWDLVPLALGKSIIGCRWVYTIKCSLDRQVDRLKARLVVKSFIQVFGQNYLGKFSPVAKLTSVRLLLSLATIFH